LKEKNITFRELVDEARYTVARHLLADTSFEMVRVGRSARLLRSERLLARFPSLVGQESDGLARRSSAGGSKSWRSRGEIDARVARGCVTSSRQGLIKGRVR
jgi:hypothetical protein